MSTKGIIQWYSRREGRSKVALRLRDVKLLLFGLCAISVSVLWGILPIPRYHSELAISFTKVPNDMQAYLALRANARAALGLDREGPSSFHFGATNRSTYLYDGKFNIVPPLTITQFSHVYGPSEIWMDRADNVWRTCRYPCEAVGGYGNATAAASADVVVLNLQDFSGVSWKRPVGQVWVGTYFESPVHYPNLEKPGVVAQFDVTMGFRPDADLPVFNMIYDTFKDFARTSHYLLPGWERKRSKPMTSVWISNCAVDTTQRLSILEQLASHGITYASYGRCQTTHSLQEALSTLDIEEWRRYADEGTGAEVVAVATQHLFFYAAENSEYPYYISEKVFHGLLAGSVPVYIGDSTHLRMIAPPRSIIYADEFESVEELAKHLRALSQDRELYEDYQKWRMDDQSMEALRRIMALPEWAGSHPREYACALCEMLHLYCRRGERI